MRDDGGILQPGETVWTIARAGRAAALVDAAATFGAMRAARVCLKRRQLCRRILPPSSSALGHRHAHAPSSARASDPRWTGLPRELGPFPTALGRAPAPAEDRLPASGTTHCSSGSRRELLPEVRPRLGEPRARIRGGGLERTCSRSGGGHHQTDRPSVRRRAGAFSAGLGSRHFGAWDTARARAGSTRAGAIPTAGPTGPSTTCRWSSTARRLARSRRSPRRAGARPRAATRRRRSCPRRARPRKTRRTPAPIRPTSGRRTSRPTSGERPYRNRPHSAPPFAERAVRSREVEALFLASIAAPAERIV